MLVDGSASLYSVDSESATMSLNDKPIDYNASQSGLMSSTTQPSHWSNTSLTLSLANGGSRGPRAERLLSQGQIELHCLRVWFMKCAASLAKIASRDFFLPTSPAIPSWVETSLQEPQYIYFFACVNFKEGRIYGYMQIGRGLSFQCSFTKCMSFHHCFLAGSSTG
jgi:hypothetical protein